MKLKVIILDLEFTPRAKRLWLRVGIAVAFLLGGGAIAYAGNLVTWSAGQTLKAADLDSNFSVLQAEIATLQSETHPSSAFRAISTVPVAVSSLVPKTVVFDTVVFDVANEYDNSSGIFSPNQAGYYLLTCGVEYQTNGQASGAVWSVIILNNDIEVEATDVENGGPNEGIRPEITTLVHLAANDHVICNTFTTASVAETLDMNEHDRNAFSGVRVN